MPCFGLQAERGEEGSLFHTEPFNGFIFINKDRVTYFTQLTYASGTLTCANHSPFMLGLVNDQQDLELLGEGGRGSRLLHETGGGCSRLFDHVGDGAEGAEEPRGTAGGRGLGLLRLLGQLGRTALLGCRGAGWRLGGCWSFGRGLGRHGRRGGRCTLLGR
ncbi:hypothetical protein INR49_029788 [Caranx melampygus]|nr:hypothetical protein INR49_029788 [Caranx melampygus]